MSTEKVLTVQKFFRTYSASARNYQQLLTVFHRKTPTYPQLEGWFRSVWHRHTLNMAVTGFPCPQV